MSIAEKAGHSRKEIVDKIQVIDREIEWNIRRLGNLIMSDEDREQTEDLIMDLRKERDSLSRYRHAD